MTTSSIDVAGLSTAEKRELLARLLKQRAEVSASAHPLSYGQRSLWFLHQLAPGSPAYNITYAGHISGRLDESALEKAVQGLVDRHAILRTTYAVREGQPVQLVHPRWPARITRCDIDSDAEFDRWLRREADRPFDLEAGPVLRVSLVRRASGEHTLVLVVHHIAVDFWSIDVILDELRRLYAAQHSAQAPAARPETYIEHVERQSRMLAGPDGERLWAYWRDRLAGDLPVIELPVDRPRRAAQTYRGGVHRFTIDRGLTAALKETGRTAGATPYMTLLAAYTALLHRYSGQQDILIGSPFADRERLGSEGVVGYFANPLVLRLNATRDAPFTTLLAHVKQIVLEAFAHQQYPFTLLVERLKPVRDASTAPLYQVSFAWEQHRRFREGSDGDRGATTLDMRTVHIGQGGAPDELMMLMGERDGELVCALQYNTDLFDAATIERIAGHFRTLLAGIVADPAARLSELPLLTDAERREQAQWNTTRVDFDAPDCLHDMVAAVVERSPDAIAVTYEGDEVTYAELHRRAEKLAARLQSLGVAPDTIVPVLLPRSIHLVVALLAVVEAGGAFMPIDPTQPVDRIAAMVSGVAQSPLCLTYQRFSDRLSDFAGVRLCLDHSVEADTPARPAHTTAANLAYVIHTSGSTGVPKGVLITHGGIRNRLLWMQQADPLGADDRMLHQTPVTFDVSIVEIFWPLIAGARVVIAAPEGHKDVGYLVRTMAEQAVTTALFVPSMLRAILADPNVAECTALRRVSCGGEPVPYELTQRFLATLNANLWNEYGPAEAAVTATSFRCVQGAAGPRVPIGRPIANVRVHLLDAAGQPVPVGVPGELYIAGAGVGRGYLNRPDATAAQFVADRFGGEPGKSMYRTGDLARYLPDGNIEYLGRLDDQVKVRGVRIELGEVEAAVSKCPGIRECAVVPGRDASGHTRLVAYLVPAQDPAPSTADLRSFLVDKLPTMMVPAVFRITESLPHNTSGKVDRRALTAVAADEPPEQREYVAPRTRAESILAGIWREVLDVDRIGIHDDFFALGGCSTHSLEVTTKARAAGLALTPEAVFLCGTIAALAAEDGSEDSADRNRGPVMAPEVADVVEETTHPAAVVPARRRRTHNTLIESIGTYLPAEAVSTAAVLAGCATEIGIPMERLTGIRNRRVVAPGEFSIDLSRQAVVDCMSRSSHGPGEIDLLIACNISRCDGPDHKFVFEPGTAVRLRDRCGFVNAVAFDISNACAGMWTGIKVADAFLQTGGVRCAMVVSGEYITHLTETAQKEIDGPMDPRLACLTLGDAGAAVILERGPNDRVGFHDIEMATLGRYSKLCVAKVTDKSHGGAIMVTDSIGGTAVAVKAAVPFVSAVMQRHGWRPQSCDHLVIHQTSESSLNDAMLAINRVFGKAAAHPGNTVFNLAERGNTASTSHFVALKDHILGNRIQSGDNAVFGISGSGQTVGAALYTFDDLPDRLRRNADGHNGQAPNARRTPNTRASDHVATHRVRIAGVGTAPAQSAQPDSVDLAVRAARACLDDSGLGADALDLLIHAGVYRSEFISEPAIAAFIAGELGMNDDIRSPDGPKTLAFDLLNGAVGFLNGCHAATEMIDAGTVETAMVVAAEIENNGGQRGGPLLGILETGSAVILRRGDGTEGFGRFVYRHDPAHADALATYTRHENGRTWLHIDRDPELTAHLLACIPDAVEELLEREGLTRAGIAAVFGPHLPDAARAELATRLGIPQARFAAPEVTADPFSSALPYNLVHARRHGSVGAGDTALVLAAGSGLQIACTTYRF
ncbi:non-ribosomal peptide synthetase [Mycobacterium sp. GA-2829]|uniref:non-ribosomal peptide synthetase n=1 Tax=Mycobacterium sp. GA-2829 TaxID=1772283 RepID=UPI00074040BD|nr:non-ribosomal peptide synthetase [Mycobacterium sp. GA-2829]KUI38295.1 non-ribosomal peptide synthetase [Mycobacterium sp. GA-2829]